MQIKSYYLAGAASAICVILIAVAISTTVYILNDITNFYSEAQEELIEFKDLANSVWDTMIYEPEVEEDLEETDEERDKRSYDDINNYGREPPTYDTAGPPSTRPRVPVDPPIMPRTIQGFKAAPPTVTSTNSPRNKGAYDESQPGFEAGTTTTTRGPNYTRQPQPAPNSGDYDNSQQTNWPRTRSTVRPSTNPTSYYPAPSTASTQPRYYTSTTTQRTTTEGSYDETEEANAPGFGPRKENTRQPYTQSTPPPNYPSRPSVPRTYHPSPPNAPLPRGMSTSSPEWPAPPQEPWPIDETTPGNEPRIRDSISIETSKSYAPGFGPRRNTTPGQGQQPEEPYQRDRTTPNPSHPISPGFGPRSRVSTSEPREREETPRNSHEPISPGFGPRRNTTPYPNHQTPTVEQPWPNRPEGRRPVNRQEGIEPRQPVEERPGSWQRGATPRTDSRIPQEPSKRNRIPNPTLRQRPSTNQCDMCSQQPNTCPVGSPGPRGRPGPPGFPGQDGPRGLRGLNGGYVDTDSAAQNVNDGIGCIQCPVGAAGERGPDGPPGPPGEDGIDGESGDNGRDGEPGVPGAPGYSGMPGVPGRPGKYGLPGAKGQAFRSIPGPPGVPGPAGPPGRPGDQGIDGEHGQDGSPGIQGRPGADGRPGLDGTPGVGAPGAPGSDGGYCPCPRRSSRIVPTYDELAAVDSRRPIDHSVGIATGRNRVASNYEDDRIYERQRRQKYDENVEPKRAALTTEYEEAPRQRYADVEQPLPPPPPRRRVEIPLKHPRQEYEDPAPQQPRREVNRKMERKSEYADDSRSYDDRELEKPRDYENRTPAASYEDKPTTYEKPRRIAFEEDMPLRKAAYVEDERPTPRRFMMPTRQPLRPSEPEITSYEDDRRGPQAPGIRYKRPEVQKTEYDADRVEKYEDISKDVMKVSSTDSQPAEQFGSESSRATLPPYRRRRYQFYNNNYYNKYL